MVYVIIIQWKCTYFFYSFEKKIMKRRTTLLVVISLCVTNIMSAQSYTVDYNVMNYEPLVNANLLNESNPEIELSGSELYKAIPIGFDFLYHDMTFDSLLVGGIGFVKFEQDGIFESLLTFLNVLK